MVLQGEPPVGAGVGRRDCGRPSGLVDLEIVGAVPAATSTRQQQRRISGETAERLAGGEHRDEQSAAPDQRQRAASTHVGGAGWAATSPSMSGASGTVLAREVRSTVRNDRERRPVTIFGNLISTWTTKPR